LGDKIDEDKIGMAFNYPSQRIVMHTGLTDNAEVQKTVKMPVKLGYHKTSLLLLDLPGDTLSSILIIV
jgi:hypothetical protein